MKFIVDQDRENIYISTGILRSELQESEGVFYGINLYQTSPSGEEQFLGTYDTVEDALGEMTRIYSTKLEIYAVSGFEAGIYGDRFTATDDVVLKAWAEC